MPVENAEYQRISEAKALKALEPREKVRLIDLRQHKGPNVREVAAGTVGGFVVSSIHLSRPEMLLTINSNKPNQSRLVPKKTKLPAASETYFWTKSSDYFANILTGSSRISKLGRTSPNSISRRHWKWLLISFEPAILP